MCERNLGSTLSTFAINRQVGCHERLVRTAYGMSLLVKILITILHDLFSLPNRYSYNFCYSHACMIACSITTLWL
jgi:putative copper export protein